MLLLPSHHIDVRPEAIEPFRRDIGNVYNLSRSLTDSGGVPFHRRTVDRAARPASRVHGERLVAFSALRQPYVDTVIKRTAPAPSRDPKSPA